jgi:hypothetical protein
LEAGQPPTLRGVAGRALVNGATPVGDCPLNMRKSD